MTAFLMLAAFALALGYCAGRIDRADLGPWRRKRKPLAYVPMPRGPR